jgi:DoxX-like family
MSLAPPPAPAVAPTSKGMLWTGRILTGLAGLFMLFDGAMKIVKEPHAVEGTKALGYPENVLVPLGIVLVACAVIYLFPRTSVFGAILLTGYLGGAVASQVRIDAGAFPILFPVIFAAIMWGGLYFRDARLRALVPFARSR